MYICSYNKCILLLYCSNSLRCLAMPVIQTYRFVNINIINFGKTSKKQRMQAPVFCVVNWI